MVTRSNGPTDNHHLSLQLQGSFIARFSSLSSSDFNVLFCFFTFITHFKPQQPAFFSGEDLNTRVQYLLSTKQQADTTGDELMKWELLETKIALITSLPQLYFTLFFPTSALFMYFTLGLTCFIWLGAIFSKYPLFCCVQVLLGWLYFLSGKVILLTVCSFASCRNLGETWTQKRCDLSLQLFPVFEWRGGAKETIQWLIQ